MPETSPPLSAATLALLREHLHAVVGPIELLESFEDMVAESGSEEWRDPGAQGLWIFGRATNGDAWAIDSQNGEAVVVLSHDMLWEEEVASPRDGACPVAESLALALQEAREGTLPVDYFSAIEGEALEEPDSKLTFAPGALDAGLTATPTDRAAILGAFFGPDTAVTWDTLEEIFFELEPMERAVLAARYGLFGARPASVDATADTVGMLPEAVVEEEARGIRWLRRFVAKRTNLT